MRISAIKITINSIKSPQLTLELIVKCVKGAIKIFLKDVI